MKVLVTGASGQLGWDVCRELERRGIPFRGASSKDFDLTTPGDVRAYIAEYAPESVIHCAAYTAVDRAEDEPELCRAVNVEGTRIIAQCCRELGAKMLYISTDYVFPGDGERPYEVDDETGPLNVYGRTKLEGEEAVKELLEKYFIVRISWVFGAHGNNFVKTMLKLAECRKEIRVVCDQFGSPTYTADLAPLLCDMVQSEKYGVYHATNEGGCSWAEFAQEIFRIAGKDVLVRPILSSEYPAKAARAHNSQMSKQSLDSSKLYRLPLWKDALWRFLNGPITG